MIRMTRSSRRAIIHLPDAVFNGGCVTGFVSAAGWLSAVEEESPVLIPLWPGVG
jgi:hypothetical protein